ncbi:alpha/beta hydrolase [Enterococcus rotai]|uniref:alpha/beta hydrolase n=1 Tax=Enterococcus rotai TaxID=118060 RepID=UPI0032B50D2E
MKKVLLILLISILAIVIACAGVLFFTPKPLFALIQAIPLEAKLTKPSSYQEIENKIKAIHDIPYSKDDPESTLDIYLPKKVSSKLPVILFVHGGGFFKGNKEMAKYFGPTISDGNYAFVSIDYNLAPNATIFDQVRQVNEALTFVVNNADTYHLDPTQMNLSGSSAGGFLALQLLSAYHDKEYAKQIAVSPVNNLKINSVILYSAVFDLSEFQRYQGNLATNYLLNKVGWGLTGEKAWKTDKELGKLLDLSEQISKDFPPLFITDGNTKTFTKQAKQYVGKLEKQNIPVNTLFFDGAEEVGHGYQLNMETKASRQAIEQTRMFLEKYNSIYTV